MLEYLLERIVSLNVTIKKKEFTSTDLSTVFLLKCQELSQLIRRSDIFIWVRAQGNIIRKFHTLYLRPALRIMAESRALSHVKWLAQSEINHCFRVQHTKNVNLVERKGRID